MALYRRRLPHDYETESPVFITWRLKDTLPTHRHFASATTSGKAFDIMDRLLDETTRGTFYLRQPEIAAMVVEAIHYNANILSNYTIHAYVVMPNPLKSITAKRANEFLRLTGRSFWQEESYDRRVRHRTEFARIQSYIENNPVRAGLAAIPCDFPWSSAYFGDRGSLADPGVRPTRFAACRIL